mmetsp:Transcript_140618/g.262330  ORF Transcript_140618/g.262330 Transcript_140618/m.262330 type:complete len:848 (+) Transcript_140618:55-2598(+)
MAAIHKLKKGASAGHWLLISSVGLLLAAVATYASTSGEAISTAGAQDKNCTDPEDTSSFLQSLVVHTAEVGSDGHPAASLPVPKDDPHKTDEESTIEKVLDTDLLGDALEPSHHGSSDSEHGDQSHNHGYMSLLFLFMGLTLGSLILMMQERYLPGIPYTCILFFTGCGIGVIHNMPGTCNYWKSWQRSVAMFENFDPHLIFYVFLPALIFSEAMQLNVHRVRSSLLQILLLAVPGVLLGTTVMGAFCHYVLPYNWDWPICLAVGSILSATDPVAVVSLFKSLGVSPHLTVIISGESLFNDGTAVVVFQLMLKLALGATLSPRGVILFFANMTVSSCLIGLCVGGLGLWIISCCAFARGNGDEMNQVMITICCGYMCFIIAESEASSSGILSLVSGGLLLAAFAWPRFLSREVVHIVWETIEFIGNTMVFLLSGLLFADACMTNQEHIRWVDNVWVFVMYGAAILIRAFTILVLWVPMQYAGARLTWREGLVMVWAGLRGAVSLALAIIVDLEPSISKAMGTRVMYHVGGIAGLTLLINSTTTAKLLNLLGLTEEPEERAQMLKHIESHMTKYALEEMQKQMEKEDDLRFKNANVELIYQMIPRLRLLPVTRQHSMSKRSQQLQIDAKEMAFREVFLEVVQSEYWAAVECGILPRNFKVARILLNSKDEAQSQIHEKLSDWDYIVRNLDVEPTGGRLGKYLSSLAENRSFTLTFPFLPGMFPSENIIHSWKVMACLSFLEAHKHARDEVPNYFDLSDVLTVQAQKKVEQESLEECQKAEELLSQVPDYALQHGKSRMLAKKLVHIQIEKLKHLLHHGVLSSSEGDHFYRDLRATMNCVADDGTVTAE